MTPTNASRDSDSPFTSGDRPTGTSAGRGPRLYLTGERTLPGIESETYWFCRHVAGYRWAQAGIARSLTDDRRAVILDSGCGEGYGTAMVAAAAPAALAVGVDLFPDAAIHAADAYPGSVYACSDAASLPFGAATFDAVVSLQVIEHLADPAAYAAECARVLRPGGTFLVATPNRITFTPPGRPKNPFHIVEFSGDELAALLGDHFAEVELAGLADRHPGLADALIDAAFAAVDPPAWAAATVPHVSADDFVTTADVDASLDLLATCRL